jgi:hypothetical protein
VFLPRFAMVISLAEKVERVKLLVLQSEVLFLGGEKGRYSRGGYWNPSLRR